MVTERQEAEGHLNCSHLKVLNRLLTVTANCRGQRPAQRCPEHHCQQDRLGSVLFQLSTSTSEHYFAHTVTDVCDGHTVMQQQSLRTQQFAEK